MTPGEAREILEDAGQTHLVAHAATLDDAASSAFLTAAAAHPWTLLRAALDTPEQGPPPLRPPIALKWKRQQAQGGLRRRLAKLGEGLLAGGRVATLLLAGGQGTRLGHPGPKGTFVFGPQPDRTLYRILGERVAAVGRRCGTPVSYYVLVSRQTEAATREAFEDAADWGLDPAQVHFIVQGELPCLDDDGRAILAEEGELAMAPDGHGGGAQALWDSGALADLLAADVDVLTTFQVDNPLGRPLDPVMLGWMVDRKAHVVSKAVAKSSPDEAVGVFARDLQGRHRIVEYSELPDGGAEDLTLGSIAIHAFSVRWLHDLMAGDYDLPLHRARKKVPFWAAETGRVEPDAPNATKFERFIFDVFPEAPRLEVHEVQRAWEFAPVKNAEGVDSPHTSRVLVDAEVRRWHRETGRPEPDEISLMPLVFDGEGALY